MTREQFLKGVSFKLKGLTYKGDWTYRYEKGFRVNEGSIVRESRSFENERVISYSYHNNISKVGRVAVEGFTYVFNKKVKVKVRFEDMIEFKEEA